MKFYWKIFISFFILIATAFSICGTWMISASFRASYHREIESGNSKNEMVRMSLGNIVGSMPADYFTKHKNAMKEICSSFAVSFGGDSDFFTIYNDQRSVVYSSGKPQNNDVLFAKAGKNKSAREIYKSKDTYYLRIVSYTILPSDLKGYYVETVTNINNIYLQRQEMTRMYHYIMFIILVSCMILSLALSYFLTYRVRVLSASTRSFADGDLNSRVQVHGQDEIATLAADFNRMADSLQEKIDEISIHGSVCTRIKNAAHFHYRLCRVITHDGSVAGRKVAGGRLYLFTGKTLGILVIQTVGSICSATAGAYLRTGFIVRTYRCNCSNDETKSCSQRRDVINASRSCNAIWRQRSTLITAYQSDRQRQKGFLVWRYDHCAWLFRQ